MKIEQHRVKLVAHSSGARDATKYPKWYKRRESVNERGIPEPPNCIPFSNKLTGRKFSWVVMICVTILPNRFVHILIRPGWDIFATRKRHGT